MKRSFLLGIFVLLLLAVNAEAANYFVRPSGGSYGVENGSDWNNAFDGFSGINWGAIHGGDTIWAAGGSYSDAIVPGASGSSDSSRIIVKRATSSNSECTSASGWSSSYDSQVLINNSTSYINNRSNITIDGQVNDGIKIYITSHGKHGVELEGSVSNVTLKNLKIQGPGYKLWYTTSTRGIDATPSSGTITNFLIDSCEIYNFESFIYLSFNNYTTIQNCIMHHGDSTNDAVHENAIYSDLSNNITVRWNTFYSYAAEGVFLRSYQDNWDIYGNVFYNASLGVECKQDSPHNNINVYNNTFANMIDGTIRYRGNDTGVAKNNIVYGTHGIIWASGVTHDYNWYSGSSNQGEAHGTANGSANPFEGLGSNNFRLASGVNAINMGTSLSATFNTDMDGNTRGQDGAWDAGAFEKSGTSSVVVPNPPSGLSVN